MDYDEAFFLNPIPTGVHNFSHVVFVQFVYYYLLLFFYTGVVQLSFCWSCTHVLSCRKIELGISRNFQLL